MTVCCGNPDHDEALSAVHHHDTIDEVRQCFHAGMPSLKEDAYLAYEDAQSQRTCSICDGLGHGYPVGRPCPLEVNEAQAFEEDSEERDRRS